MSCDVGLKMAGRLEGAILKDRRSKRLLSCSWDRGWTCLKIFEIQRWNGQNARGVRPDHLGGQPKRAAALSPASVHQLA